ncbi:MAG: hypothetical protein HYX27_11480 [Acidobacteria bacterium]|nr:hypothetical protein [Acidobacteriota bacterium]
MWQRVLWIFPMLLCAEDVPVGVVSGYISDIQKSSFLLKTVTHKEFRCTYDHRTWFEQSRIRVAPNAFQPSDLVEIVADRRLIDGMPCYVRTVRLADLNAKESGRMRITYRAVTESIIPRGEYQWAGTVSELTPEKLVLRTRTEGYKTLVLRRDTRYMEDGVVSERARLQPNTQISIRAGRNLSGEVEVYQIIWGSVTPR